jgi:hypothetical protein
MHPHAATCPTTLNLATLPRWALALPCVQWLWTSPPNRGGLRCCYVSSGFEPHFLAEVGSGGAVCHMAPDPTSLSGRVPVLPCIPRFSVGRVP